MNNSQHIFFDLDDTLWDFERNAEESLTELFSVFQLEKLGKNVTLSNFKSNFHIINKNLWHQFNHNLIDQKQLREQRFLLLLTGLGVPKNDIPFEKLSTLFLEIAPLKLNLIPNTIEILTYLKAKNYHLHIITNGFEAIQNTKINNTKIGHFFDLIVTSEHTNTKKPSKEIFEYATDYLKINEKNCTMIGDNVEADVAGAKNVHWNSIWYNPKKLISTIEPDYTIDNLLALKDIFH